MAILPNRAQVTYSVNGASDVVLSNQTNTNLIDRNTMTLTKTPVADTVRAGGDAVYIVRLENTGIGTLYNPTFTDNLGGTPNLLGYRDGSAKFFLNGESVEGTANAGADDVVFSYGSPISAGDNLIVIYAASTAETATGTITNTVTAQAQTEAQTEIQTADIITAQASASITVSSYANVSVFKTADKETVTSGDTLTYTFTLMNTGAQIAEGISFSDALPPEFTVTGVSYTAGGVETPIAPADYTITDPNTLIIPAAASALEITVPAMTAEGPGITVITVTGTIA